jgi:tetratricopeptide (TPR) repeat protein
MTQTDNKFELLEPLDDLPGPAKRISSQRAAELVGAVLEQGAVASDQAAPRSASPRPWRRVALVAAALLVVAGGASAAIYELAVKERASEPAPPEPAASTAGAPEPAPEPVAEPIEETIEEPAPVEPAPIKRRRARRDRPAPLTDIAETPDDLLARANEHRKARSWPEAAALYERVRREHRGTVAAYVATLASASIYLEHLDEPDKALKRYRAAMRSRPNGYLAEEARYGIAEAHRARGARKAEAEALREFLTEHPDSPLRERADKRLRRIAPSAEKGEPADK